jgi:hypothetical protein
MSVKKILFVKRSVKLKPPFVSIWVWTLRTVMKMEAKSR